MKSNTKFSRKYKNTIILLLSLPLVYLAAHTPWAEGLLAHSNMLGLGGAFILGIFFVSTFTIVPASILLYNLAQSFDPVLLALFAGAGGVVGDFVIFRYYRDHIFEEWKPAIKHLLGGWFRRLECSKVFGWVLPLIGALIVISPFPDEIGIGLMGLSHLKNKQFIVLIFLLDTLGMYIFALVSQRIGA